MEIKNITVIDAWVGKPLNSLFELPTVNPLLNHLPAIMFYVQIFASLSERGEVLKLKKPRRLSNCTCLRGVWTKACVCKDSPFCLKSRRTLNMHSVCVGKLLVYTIIKNLRKILVQALRIPGEN